MRQNANIVARVLMCLCVGAGAFTPNALALNFIVTSEPVLVTVGETRVRGMPHWEVMLIETCGISTNYVQTVIFHDAEVSGGTRVFHVLTQYVIPPGHVLIVNFAWECDGVQLFDLEPTGHPHH